MSITDDEMLEVFIQEAREHLDSLEPDLLSMEENPNDEEIINRIFRSVHSIKGTSGFFGLDKISNMAHVMESLMALVRDGEITLNPHMLDALLAGTDKLRVMVDDPEESTSVDIDSEVKGLQPFINKSPNEINTQTTPKATPPVQDTATTDTTAIESDAKISPATDDSLSSGDSNIPNWLSRFKLVPEDFKRAIREKQAVYIITIQGNKDVQEKDQLPLDFINELKSLGELLDSLTDQSNIKNFDNIIDGELIFLFHFASQCH